MIAAAGLKILPVDNLDEAARWVFQLKDHFKLIGRPYHQICVTLLVYDLRL